MAVGKACALLLIVALLAGSASTEARSLQQADLLSAAGNVLGGAVGIVENGLTTLVTGLFGPQNTFLTKIPEDIKKLSWDGLKNLDIKTPVEGFLKGLKDISLPTDIFSVENQISGFLDKFCIASECQPTVKVPSNCVGKSMIVRLAPWKCSLLKDATVGCTPPFIEILSSPAGCAAKYNKAGFFKGRECKLEKLIGSPIKKTIGGHAFSVSIDKTLLDIPRNIASSLLPGATSLASGIGAAASTAFGAAASGLGGAASGLLGAASSGLGGVASGVGGVASGLGNTATNALSSASGASSSTSTLDLATSTLNLGTAATQAVTAAVGLAG